MNYSFFVAECMSNIIRKCHYHRTQHINWTKRKSKQTLTLYITYVTKERKGPIFSPPTRWSQRIKEKPQSQVAANPWCQEVEEKDTNQHAQNNKRTKSTQPSSLFPKRGNRNAKRTAKTRTKHEARHYKSPCRINHKATHSKSNTGATFLERSVV